jgi:hypothetical protein
MRLNSGSQYFDDQYNVTHIAQGDIFANVPHAVFGALGEPVKPRGARKRGLVKPDKGLAIVLPYTCQIVAQPPGTVGYSLPVVIVAPIRNLASLVDKKNGMKATEVRKIRDGNGVAAFSYMPLMPEWGYTGEEDGEFAGHGAVMLYAMHSVITTEFEKFDRVARLSEGAQRILMADAASLFMPNAATPDPMMDELEPDRSDSWRVEASTDPT